MPTTIPIQREPILNHASISGSNEIPTDVAVANTPVTPALNELVSILIITVGNPYMDDLLAVKVHIQSIST